VKIAIVAVALVMILRPPGPRATHIEHRRDKHESEDEQ
jgi:hypothetical protein